MNQRPSADKIKGNSLKHSQKSCLNFMFMFVIVFGQSF